MYHPQARTASTDPLAYWLAQPPESSRSLTSLRIVARNLALRRATVWMLVPISVVPIILGIVLLVVIPDVAPGAFILMLGVPFGIGLVVGLLVWRRNPVPSHMKILPLGRAPKTVPEAVGSLVVLAVGWWIFLGWKFQHSDGGLLRGSLGEFIVDWGGAGLGPVLGASVLLLPQALCLAHANTRLRRLIDSDPRIRAELAQRARNPGESRFEFGPL